MKYLKGSYLMPHPPIMIDEIGGENIKVIQDTYDSCCEIGRRIAEIKPDTIVVITPHGQIFDDALAIYLSEKAYGDLGSFGHSEITINKKYNYELSTEIIENCRREDIYVGTIDEDMADMYGIEARIDHGTQVPLYFVDKYYRDYKLVHINYGLMNNLKSYRAGMAIAKAIESNGENVVVIASGDLSHRLLDSGPYDYHPSGKEFDTEIIELLREGDVKGIYSMDEKMIEEAGECGMNSIYVLLGILDRYDFKADILSYEGPFGVGYGVVDFQLMKGDSKYKDIKDAIDSSFQLKIKDESELVRLARNTINTYAKYGDIYEPNIEELTSWLPEKAGVFVSIKKYGQLRGCIGTLMPVTDNVVEEISRNAIEAGFKDPRFSPIKKEELKDLSISVDVLGEAERVMDKSTLDPKMYGVIVSAGEKVGVLLPMLDGVNTIEEQLDIAKNKAGILDDEEFEIEKFKVVRYI